MKKLLLTLAIAATSFVTKAQTYISTNNEKECYYNSYTSKYDKNCTQPNRTGLFTLNKDETILHHTTAAISSDYYIQSSYANDEKTIFTFNVKSDAGNSYTFVADMTALELRIYNFKEGYVKINSIKKVWQD